jgi:L-alanine-DL-glutamate epimerase-like enolase superfamily enzyme
MKIETVEVFQVRWSPDDKPAQGSAFVRIHCDNGVSGSGRAVLIPATWPMYLVR